MNIPETPLLPVPDLEPLKESAADYLAYLRAGKNLSGNGWSHREHDILEKALSALYGTEVWTEISTRTMKIDK